MSKLSRSSSLTVLLNCSIVCKSRWRVFDQVDEAVVIISVLLFPSPPPPTTKCWEVEEKEKKSMTIERENWFIRRTMNRKLFTKEHKRKLKWDCWLKCDEQKTRHKIFTVGLWEVLGVVVGFATVNDRRERLVKSLQWLTIEQNVCHSDNYSHPGCYWHNVLFDEPVDCRQM